MTALVARRAPRWGAVAGRSTLVLVVALALVTPLATLLYDLVGPSLYLARNLSASQPAMVVLVAIVACELARRVPGRAAIAIAAVGIAGLGLIVVRSLDPDTTGPPTRRPRATSRRSRAPTPSSSSPAAHARQPPRALAAAALPQRPAPAVPLRRRATPGVAGRPRRRQRLLRGAGRGGAAARARLRPHARRRPGAPHPGGRAEQPAARARHADLPRLRHGDRAAPERRGGGEISEGTIDWTFGSGVPIEQGAAEGAAGVTPVPGGADLAGWAVDSRTGRPADWILVFSDDRLVAVTALGAMSLAARRARGAPAELSGFAMRMVGEGLEPDALRVVAVTGDRAGTSRSARAPTAANPAGRRRGGAARRCPATDASTTATITTVLTGPMYRSTRS